MKNIMRSVWLVLALVLCVPGCGKQARHVKQTKQEVTVYLERPTNGGDAVYVYQFQYNGHWYHHFESSLLDEADWDAFAWIESDQPAVVNDAPGVGVVAQMEVPNADLGREMAMEIDTTEQQIADMISEGNPNNADVGETTSADTGGDSFSAGDSSSGDSGGGDSGGGGD